MTNIDHPDQTEDTLSRPYDKIEILFELVDGTTFWWPCDVITIEEALNGGTLRETAQVEYAVRRRTSRQLATVEFVANRTVLTSDGETPWRTSDEAADAGDAGETEKL